MVDDYQKRVNQTAIETEKAQGELMEMAQRLAPDYWVLQYTFNSWNPNPRERYTAYVTNGDDNVTAHGKTLNGAIARLIAALLDGGVFPLTGQGGRYVAHQDRPYVQDRERKEREELLKVLDAAENCIGGCARTDPLAMSEVMLTLGLLRDQIGKLRDD